MSNFRPSRPSGIKRCRTILATVLIGTLILTSVACKKGIQPTRETRFIMGTLVEIVAYPSSETTRAAVNRAFERMEEIEDQAYPDRSEFFLSLREGKPSALPEVLARVLDKALSVASESEGAFDPTLGRVVSLWGFDRNEPGIPADEDLAAALRTVGYRRLSVDSDGVVRPTPPGNPLWLELGGVAKGYAVDVAVAELTESGIQAGIVNAGGDLRSFGVRPDRGFWRIGIQDPDDPQGMLGVLEVDEGSVATSGDYERYFEKDGIRFHHILDPTSGLPVRNGIRSATVITRECGLADALATAAFVMGPEKGLALLERLEGVEGILVVDGEDLLTTSGVGGRIGFDRR